MRLERVAHWAEIVANFGVIVTLVILILQVQENTQVLRSQAIASRAVPMFEPFVHEGPLPRILARIKEVDGPEPMVDALMERYSLSYADAASWSRHMSHVWTSLDAEYELVGGSEALANRIRSLLQASDQAVWFENGGARRAVSLDFLAYIETVSETP